MPVSVRNTDILFNDGSTQVTSALPSSFSAIGSLLIVANYSTSSFVPGNLIAGSSLLYATAITYNAAYRAAILEGNPAMGVSVSVGFDSIAVGGIQGNRSGNIGAFQPSNTTTLPGTWRALSPAGFRTSLYDEYGAATIVSYRALLVQRIS